MKTRESKCIKTMGTKYKVCLFAVGFMFLQGCTSWDASGPLFIEVPNIPEDQGLVYIYRQSEFFGSAVAQNITVNGKMLVKLHNKGYYPYFSEPGDVLFATIGEGTAPVILEVKPQEIYYLRWSYLHLPVGTAMVTRGAPYTVGCFTVIPKEQARIEVAKCHKEVGESK